MFKILDEHFIDIVLLCIISGLILLYLRQETVKYNEISTNNAMPLTNVGKPIEGFINCENPLKPIIAYKTPTPTIIANFHDGFNNKTFGNDPSQWYLWWQNNHANLGQLKQENQIDASLSPVSI